MVGVKAALLAGFIGALTVGGVGEARADHRSCPPPGYRRIALPHRRPAPHWQWKHDRRRDDRAESTFSTDVWLEGRRIEVTLTLARDCDGGSARVQFTTDDSQGLPDLERVSLKVRGAGIHWNPRLYEADERCDTDSRAVFEADDGPRWSANGCSGVWIELNIATDRDVEKTRWRGVTLN